MTDNLRMEQNTSAQVKWSTKEAWNSGISEFQASLVYKVSSRKAKATKRKPVLKNKNKYKTKNKNKTTATKKYFYLHVSCILMLHIITDIFFL